MEETITNGELARRLDMIQRQIDSDLGGDIKTIFGKLENKVSFQQFTWILGLLMMIVVGLLALIYQNQLTMSRDFIEVKTGFAEVKTDVATLKKTFENYNIEIKP